MTKVVKVERIHWVSCYMTKALTLGNPIAGESAYIIIPSASEYN
jgi:hypothetical protein